MYTFPGSGHGSWVIKEKGTDPSPYLQVYKCLELWLSEPTYVSTHIVNQEKAQFPAITICPISKGYKEDVLQVSLLYDDDQ